MHHVVAQLVSRVNSYHITDDENAVRSQNSHYFLQQLVLLSHVVKHLVRRDHVDRVIAERKPLKLKVDVVASEVLVLYAGVSDVDAIRCLWRSPKQLLVLACHLSVSATNINVSSHATQLRQ